MMSATEAYASRVLSERGYRARRTNDMDYYWVDTDQDHNLPMELRGKVFKTYREAQDALCFALLPVRFRSVVQKMEEPEPLKQEKKRKFGFWFGAGLVRR